MKNEVIVYVASRTHFYLPGGKWSDTRIEMDCVDTPDNSSGLILIRLKMGLLDFNAMARHYKVTIEEISD